MVKNIRDMVPKTIMFMMVNKLKEYMTGDLLPMIYSAGDQNSLMEESQEAARRRDEMVRMYHTCKEALDLISDVGSKTGGCGMGSRRGREIGVSGCNLVTSVMFLCSTHTSTSTHSDRRST